MTDAGSGDMLPGSPRTRRGAKNRAFVGLCIVVASLTLAVLAWLLIEIGISGSKYLVGFSEEARQEAVERLENRAAWRKIDRRLLRAAPKEWGEERTAEDYTYFLAGATPAQIVEEMEFVFEDDWPPIHERLIERYGEGWASAEATLGVVGRVKAWFYGTEAGQFVTSPPSRFPESAGLGPAMWGTIWICGACAFFALPLGVGTAIFLEEFKPRSRLMRRVHSFIELNIRNLAGVPSIVYGIIGLTAFVQVFGLFGTGLEPAVTLGSPDSLFYFQLPLGRGVLAGGLTLTLVILPIVIISSQEALRAVPGSIRQGGFAVGATKWQVVSKMTIPAAIPGIMTGSILAMSRAIGEAAPILVIAGLVFIRFTPDNFMSEFTAMPLQIFDWAGRPQEEFHKVAASGIIVLLGLLLIFNATAVFIRHKFQKPLQ